MNISFYNGRFIPHDEICMSPDDRGFLFADGIYEVVRWYGSFFYDMEGHMARLQRSLREIRIIWPESSSFTFIAKELVRLNDLADREALIYLQVTRGAARRSHSFPDPPVPPTVYAFARELIRGREDKEKGISVMLSEDIRWGRCDIKSIALLPNTMLFQEALDKGMQECIFVRNGAITEGSHSNIFFVKDNILYTHPESEQILSGITRKNVLRIARDNGITVKEEAARETDIQNISEAFITNTSSEIMPVTMMGGKPVGNGSPGAITTFLIAKLEANISALKG